MKKGVITLFTKKRRSNYFGNYIIINDCKNISYTIKYPKGLLDHYRNRGKTSNFLGHESFFFIKGASIFTILLVLYFGSLSIVLLVK